MRHSRVLPDLPLQKQGVLREPSTSTFIVSWNDFRRFLPCCFGSQSWAPGQACIHFNDAVLQRRRVQSILYVTFPNDAKMAHNLEISMSSTINEKDQKVDKSGDGGTWFLTIILARNFGQTLSRYSNYLGNWTKSSYVKRYVFSNGKSVEHDYDCCSLTDVTLSAVSRSMWYSWLERVWLGATTMESPKGKKESFGGNINNLRNQQSGICAKKPTGQVWR